MERDVEDCGDGLSALGWHETGRLYQKLLLV
jgi:hypothetical protein